MAAASGKKKTFKAGLPILGLILAIALGALSWGLAGPAVSAIEGYKPDQPDSIKDNFDSLRNRYDRDSFLHDNIIELIFAGLLWFILMGSAMFIVSATLVGTSPEKEVWDNMPVSPADKKGMVKQMKRDLRDAKRKAREQKRRKKT
jgi:hypothetical protein